MMMMTTTMTIMPTITTMIFRYDFDGDGDGMVGNGDNVVIFKGVVPNDVVCRMTGFQRRWMMRYIKSNIFLIESDC